MSATNFSGGNLQVTNNTALGTAGVTVNGAGAIGGTLRMGTTGTASTLALANAITLNYSRNDPASGIPHIRNLVGNNTLSGTTTLGQALLAPAFSRLIRSLSVGPLYFESRTIFTFYCRVRGLYRTSQTLCKLALFAA